MTRKTPPMKIVVVMGAQSGGGETAWRVCEDANLPIPARFPRVYSTAKEASLRAHSITID